MTVASKITLARIGMIPLIIYMLLAVDIPYGRVIVIVLFLVTSISDAFDGYYARRLKQVTTLGTFLDPLADKLLIISVLIAMVELKLVTSLPVIIIIAREFAVTGLRLIAAGFGTVIDASLWGKYKTISQVVAVIALLLQVGYAEIILWISVVITIYSGIEYFLKNKDIFVNGQR